jgi:hypothetical protein
MDNGNTTLEMPPVDAIDAELAQHPFGDSIYITKRLHDSYELRLHKLAADMPVAGSLLDCLNRAGAGAWYREIGNTLVRCAVDHALRTLALNTRSGLSLEECEEVFRETKRRIEDTGADPVGSEFLDRLEQDTFQSAIWSEAPSEDLIVRHFRALVAHTYQCRLCAPSAEERAVFAMGVRLLGELLPQMSSSALSHVHLVAVFPAEGVMAGCASSSDIRLSGAIFINRNKLRNPWVVAEHLFHEALHQQMYDFHQGHAMLEPNPVSVRTICSLWNLPSSIGDNHWGAWRAISAFHVYVHLTLLAATAERRAKEFERTYGPVAGIGTRTARARAHYLEEQLRGVCWDELAKAGKRWVERFSAVLEAIDPSPPPSGSYLHLVLDRYWTEAHLMETYLASNGESRPEAVEQLMELAEKEVSCVRHVLSDLKALSDLKRFEDALALLPGHDPMLRFRRIRTLIVDTILDASPNGGYTLSEAMVADRLVKEMIDESSEVLRVLAER